MDAVRLFCFPFAGGSSFSYQPLSQHPSATIPWTTLDYAGRGRRLFERPFTELDELVDDLFEELRPELKKPFAFFGHSMGSLIAYRLSCRLMSEGLPLPRHVFLSGRGGACLPEKQRNARTMNQQEIVNEVQELGGDLSTLVQKPRALDYYEPVLRADLMALESYAYGRTGPAKLPVPATVLIGKQDLYTLAEAQCWQNEFTVPINLHTLPGGHFFLFENKLFINHCIQRQLFTDSSACETENSNYSSML